MNCRKENLSILVFLDFNTIRGGITRRKNILSILVFLDFNMISGMFLKANALLSILVFLDFNLERLQREQARIRAFNPCFLGF